MALTALAHLILQSPSMGQRGIFFLTQLGAGPSKHVVLWIPHAALWLDKTRPCSTATLLRFNQKLERKFTFGHHCVRTSLDKAPPAWTLSIGQKAGEMLRQMVLIQDLLVFLRQDKRSCSGVPSDRTLWFGEDKGVSWSCRWISKAVRINPGPCPPSKALLLVLNPFLVLALGVLIAALFSFLTWSPMVCSGLQSWI